MRLAPRIARRPIRRWADGTLALLIASSLFVAGETRSDPASATKVVMRAREEVTKHVAYDPSYVRISYPNGDVNPALGVCTDVVIRSYQSVGIDFQKLVHDDAARDPGSYQPWIKTLDANIDHRRVGPLKNYLERHARKLPNEANYAAGDIVVISFSACPACSPQHVGVVSDKMGPRGIPLMIHNLGPVPTEDDTLDAWVHLGHYRLL